MKRLSVGACDTHKACASCPANTDWECSSPYMRGVFKGTPEKGGLMFIGEAPGMTEDRHNMPFIGPSGQRLWAEAEDVGINLDSVYVTNAIKCLPYDGMKMVKASSAIVKICNVHLKKEIEIVQPRAILLLGNFALTSLMGKSGVARNRMTLMHYTMKDETTRIPVVLAYHPAFVLRAENMAPEFRKDLKYFAEVAGDRAPEKTGLNLSAVMGSFVIYPSADQLKEFRDNVLNSVSNTIAFDVEANTLLPRAAAGVRLLSLAISDGKQTFCIPFKAFQQRRQSFDMNETRDVLKSILGLGTIKKVGHNVKYDMHVVEVALGVTVNGVIGDTIILHSHLYPYEGGHDLDTVTSSVLGIPKYKGMIEKWVGSGNDPERWRKCPYAPLGLYNAADAFYTLKVYMHLKQSLREADSEVPAPEAYMKTALAPKEVFEKLLMPGMHALYSLERRGMKVDVSYMRKLSNDLQSERAALLTTIRKMDAVQAFEQAREAEVMTKHDGMVRPSKPSVLAKNLAEAEFKPNSNKQMGELLYGDDYFGCLATNFTASGAPKVDIEALGKLQQEMIDDYGSLTAAKLPAYIFIENVGAANKSATLDSTFVLGIKKFISKKDRVHPTFNIGRARTGRLSSDRPNFQNIPIRMGPVVRRGYVPLKGHVFLDFDYSQIELRILAAYSKDERMRQVYLSGGDLHTSTAEWLFDLEKGAIISENQRRDAKAINFGVVYGTSSFGMARIIARPQDECQHFIDRMYAAYPSIGDWQDEVRAYAKKNGRVFTMFGRWRDLANAQIELDGRGDTRFGLVKEAERQVINTPVQGTASDLTLVSMIAIEKEGIPMVNTVHDSILTEVKREDVPQTVRTVKKIMETEPLKWIGRQMAGIPIVVDVKGSQLSWGDCKGIKM